MSYSFWAVIVLFLLGARLNAQVIEADPIYPNIHDSVAITFHLELCESDFISYEGDIYAHTGVLTSESTSSSDWKFVVADWDENTEKAKLEKIDATTYILHITPSIFEYYNLADTTEVEELAFVFRTEDRSTQSADLFYSVYDTGLFILINSPEDDIIVEKDDVIPISADVAVLETSSPDSIVLFVNDTVVFVSYDTNLSYDYTAETLGQHWLKISAVNDTYSSVDSVFVFVREEIPIADLPAGTKDGVTIVNDTTVTLVIHAPNKESILAIGDFNDWELSNNYLFNKTPDGNYFWLSLTGLNAGEEYAFQYLIDGSIRIADPYTEKILCPLYDPSIPASTYPDLKPYPKGKTKGIVSVFQTVQEEYIWQTGSFEAPSKTDLVIYELHVQGFTDAGNLKTLTDTLDYLERLGINAIELMPVNEFDGNQSWGYNPSFYFALDKMYGKKNDLKAFVDACHSRGIAVIIDMVLNHSYGQSPLVQMYWNSSADKPAADNPWYNEDHNFIDNGAARWGYDFDHESAATKKLVDSINAYWMSEYQIDGFRFDFTKGMSNTPWYGDNNWASAYDADRIAILKRMSDEIWSRNEDAYVIFEHLADNTEEKELADYGIMLWGNMSHDYNEATMGYSSNFNGGSYLNRGWSEPHLVTYMESHDEERLMYKNQRWGNSNDEYDARDLATSLLRMEAAAAFLFTLPGPKMLFQWGELGNDNSINRCTDGTVNDEGGCRLDLKPLVWNYYDDPYRYRLYKVFEALIHLRVEEDLFETTDFDLSTSGFMKKIHLNSSSMNATILGNFGITSNTLNPAFQHTGTWYDYLTGESIEVSDMKADIELEPGGYKIYLDKQLDVPVLPTLAGNSLSRNDDEIKVYPNPSTGLIHIELKTAESFTFELYNITGQKIVQTYFEQPSEINSFEINSERFASANGIYFYKIILANSTAQNSIIIEK